MININLRKILGFTFVAMLIIVTIAIINWVFGHGRLELTLPAGDKTIVIEGEDYYKKTVSSEQKFSSTLPSGDYTIRVNSDNNNYVAITYVPGLLRQKSTEVKLSPENYRSFVVNEPGDCIYPFAVSFVSYSCNGTLFSLAYHQPADARDAATVTTVGDIFKKRDGEFGNPDPGSIEGVFEHKNETFAVVKGFGESGENHMLYLLEDGPRGFDVTFVDRIFSLPADTSFTAYSEGDELIFIPDGGSYFYSGSDYKKLQKTVLSVATEQANDIQDTDNEGNYLYTGFTTRGTGEKMTISGGVVRIFGNDTEEVVETGSSIMKASFCLEVYVCVLEDSGNLDVYSLNLDKKYTATASIDYTVTDNSLYILNDMGVDEFRSTDFGLEGTLVYDSELSGYSLASVDNNVYVSVQSAVGTYLLMLSDTEEGGVYADKLVKPLLDSVFVDGASLGKDVIHLSVDLGERVYDTEKGLYKINEKNRSDATSKIREIVSKGNIEANGIKVIAPRLAL